MVIVSVPVVAVVTTVAVAVPMIPASVLSVVFPIAAVG